MRPKRLAIILAAVIVAFLVLGFWAPTPVVGILAFGTAAGLVVCFGLFAGAFALDRRRRRNQLLGR